MNNENVQTKSIVTSYRLKEDTKEKVQQQLKELGLTQEQYFNKVVSLMELENIKQNSFLNKDTTILQSNLDAILNSFISLADNSNNLITNKDIELTELKNQYKDMLLEKEGHIADKKAEVERLLNGINEARELLEKEEKETVYKINEYNKQVDQLKSGLLDKTNLIEEYKDKNDMLLNDLAEYKKYKIENGTLKQSLSDLQSRNIELINSIKNKDYEADKLTEEHNYEINKLNKNIDDLKETNKKDIENLEKENKLNNKLAIAEVKEELNNKLSMQQLKHNEEIQEYQSKYKELLKELENARNKKEDSEKSV